MHVVEPADLATRLIETWAQQGRSGFLLSDPQSAAIETKEVLDPSCGVLFRFRWVPHRAMRADVAELERRGILNARRDEARLFRDARDPRGGHCFLCADNIRECHPQEVLVPLRLAGREYYAGANFAWIERDHFTVLAAEHTDQAYSRRALQAMLDLHTQTGGRFRVLFNGPGAGASIPWHLHYQITTAAMPIEAMPAGAEARYPTVVAVFSAADNAAAHAYAAEWLDRDPGHHSVNILICGAAGDARIFLFPRDQRRATVPGKGLVGGFEVAGDFVLSAAEEEPTFRAASAELARSILASVSPDDDERGA